MLLRMKRSSYSPVAFTPLPVTIITTIVYAALFTTLLVIHVVVPSAPKSPTPFAGINITEAWYDLQAVSNGFHPYNSRRNDEVRDYLLQRIEAIIRSNNAELVLFDVHSFNNTQDDSSTSVSSPDVIVFNDMISNVSFSAGVFGTSGISTYFEGTNIIVYIRGSEDDRENWWELDKKPKGHGGVLVNAHYDSVSTGFGATDDGVGVATILQLVKYFTTPGHKPKRGIVTLLNNGEEDFLNGARAFTQHPMSKFTHTFVNLEGAGAGGRATLFRTTDTEITRFYQRSSHPYGTVLSGDAFKRGVIGSQTDYIVFDDVLGLRGLDVAFFEPRARYHTDQDDTRHTTINSLWHMLSAALSTTQGLADDTTSSFEGKKSEKSKVANGQGSDGVWFDIFGSVFAVFELHTLFALSATLLVVAPIILIVIGIILYRLDKLYLFTSSKQHHHPDGDDTISIQGWRGFFRTPIIFIAASGGSVGLAFLVAKVNPFIMYSSPYAVWSMMLSSWVFVVWFLSRVADFARPTAFHRAYSLLWMFTGTWTLLVISTVLEERLKLASGYVVVFYFAAVFLATTVAFLEMFGLPKKESYANIIEDHGDETTEDTGRRPGSVSSSRLLGAGTEDEGNDDDVEPERADESTSLLRGSKPKTFANYTTPDRNRDTDAEDEGNETTLKKRVYGFEQMWSWSLPSWTWMAQFIVMAFVAIVFVGQVALLLTSAMYQTLADGNSPLSIYLLMAALTLLIMAPLGPFLHRYTYHVPTFLFCIFVGTLVYNLLAFPFSANNRLKLYFVQRVDLDTGLNEAALAGIGSPFMDAVIRSLPSTAGQSPRISTAERPKLIQYAWDGLPPQVVPNTLPEIPPRFGYADWISLNISREQGRNEAHFELSGRNTRACRIIFSSPILDFSVDGAGEDSRFKRVTEDGSKQIRLWSRTWEKPWSVNVWWGVSEGKHAGDEGIDGRVVCLWNDENETGTVPALDEIKRFAPDWVAVTKMGDGLVEGSKAFMV